MDEEKKKEEQEIQEEGEEVTELDKEKLIEAIKSGRAKVIKTRHSVEAYDSYCPH